MESDELSHSKNSKRLRVTKKNYVAIHEVNHFIATIIYLIEKGKSKNEIKKIIKGVKLMDESDESGTLGSVQISGINQFKDENATFIWIFGCLGAYYYYNGTNGNTRLDKSRSEEIRHFMLETGGEYDLKSSGLYESSLRNNWKLKMLLLKTKRWCSNEKIIKVITALAKRLLQKKVFDKKEIDNLIGTTYGTIYEEYVKLQK